MTYPEHQPIAFSLDRKVMLSQDKLHCGSPSRLRNTWTVRLGRREDGVFAGGCCIYTGTDAESKAREAFNRYSLGGY